MSSVTILMMQTFLHRTAQIFNIEPNFSKQYESPKYREKAEPGWSTCQGFKKLLFNRKIPCAVSKRCFDQLLSHQ